MIVGELSSYPNSGYVLTFDPHLTSREAYLEKIKAGEGAFFGNGARTVTLDFAVYSDTLNFWVYVQLLFEFSISDQVIFSKSFQQFRTDIYETETEKTYMYLDLIRIGFLFTVATLYITEAIMEACRNSFTVSVFTRIMLFFACVICFAMEGYFIMMQTPTADILARSSEIIDYSELVYYYQMLFYMQAVNLILLISFLIPFFQFLTDIQSTLNVITNVASLILLFGCLWWAFAVMFAYVISNTWGYQLKGFRNL